MAIRDATPIVVAAQERTALEDVGAGADDRTASGRARADRAPGS
jgi:hypothetical protein